MAGKLDERKVIRTESGKFAPGTVGNPKGRPKPPMSYQKMKEKYTKNEIELMLMNIMNLDVTEIIAMNRELTRLQHSKSDPKSTPSTKNSLHYMQAVKNMNAVEAWALSVTAKSIIRGDHKFDLLILSRIIGKIPDHVIDSSNVKADEWIKALNGAIPALEEAKAKLDSMKIVDSEIVESDDEHL